jgi:hypothetical protein
MAFWEFMSFLVFSSILGSFAYWLIAYFAVEIFLHFARGPSEQLQSLGTSVLDEPEYREPEQKLQLPKAA